MITFEILSEINLEIIRLVKKKGSIGRVFFRVVSLGEFGC